MARPKKIDSAEKNQEPISVEVIRGDVPEVPICPKPISLREELAAYFGASIEAREGDGSSLTLYRGNIGACVNLKGKSFDEAVVAFKAMGL
jgi:hypothetical protein